MSTPDDSGSSIGSTTPSLIQRVKTHDQDAWRRLVRLYGPLVDFWIRRAGLQTADAEDVFQAVFQAVARNIGTFREDRASDTFRGWLRIITRSKLIDHHRQVSSQPQATGGAEAYQQLLEVAEALSQPAEIEEATEKQNLRQRALEMIRAEFEAKTWEAFWRVVVEEQEPKDVARDLNITPSAVRLFKSRILRRLREITEGLGA